MLGGQLALPILLVSGHVTSFRKKTCTDDTMKECKLAGSISGRRSCTVGENAIHLVKFIVLTDLYKVHDGKVPPACGLPQMYVAL